MPRFFFHVHDGVELIDHGGTDLDDLDEARTQAIVFAGKMLKEKSSHLWTGSVWRMDVVDASGVRVGGLSFSADPS